MKVVSIEAVAELFKVCGEIVLVRILRPGNPIPADVKPFSNKHPEMTDKVCALVEFEKTEFAHKAVKDLCKEGEEGMKVNPIASFFSPFRRDTVHPFGSRGCKTDKGQIFGLKKFLLAANSTHFYESIRFNSSCTIIFFGLKL